MGIFSSDREELIAELSGYKARCELYKDELTTLRGQVTRLQDALVAKESPVAYDQYLSDKAMAETPPISEAEKARVKEEGDVYRRYTEMQEAPLFKDPQDMIDSLGKSLGYHFQDEVPIHNNEES